MIYTQEKKLWMDILIQIHIKILFLLKGRWLHLITETSESKPALIPDVPATVYTSHVHSTIPEECSRTWNNILVMFLLPQLSYWNEII